jgi:glucose 1-dehydrogenase
MSAAKRSKRERGYNDLKVREQQMSSIPGSALPSPGRWLAAYLASEDADYVSGHTFTIDGGLSMNLGQGA